jgi:hypothetical protein
LRAALHKSCGDSDRASSLASSMRHTPELAGTVASAASMTARQRWWGGAAGKGAVIMASTERRGSKHPATMTRRKHTTQPEVRMPNFLKDVPAGSELPSLATSAWLAVVMVLAGPFGPSTRGLVAAHLFEAGVLAVVTYAALVMLPRARARRRGIPFVPRSWRDGGKPGKGHIRYGRSPICLWRSAAPCSPPRPEQVCRFGCCDHRIGNWGSALA